MWGVLVGLTARHRDTSLQVTVEALDDLRKTARGEGIFRRPAPFRNYQTLISACHKEVVMFGNLHAEDVQQLHGASRTMVGATKFALTQFAMRIVERAGIVDAHLTLIALGVQDLR